MKKQAKRELAVIAGCTLLLFVIFIQTGVFNKIHSLAINTISTTAPSSLLASGAGSGYPDCFFLGGPGNSPLSTAIMSNFKIANITPTSATVSVDWDGSESGVHIDTTKFDYLTDVNFSYDTSNVQNAYYMYKNQTPVQHYVGPTKGTTTAIITGLLPNTRYFSTYGGIESAPYKYNPWTAPSSSPYAGQQCWVSTTTASSGFSGNSFITPDVSLATVSATSVDQISATLNGTYSGGFSNINMQYGTTTGFGSTSPSITPDPNGGTANILTSGLLPDTTYYYRIAGKSYTSATSYKTIYGATMSFHTPAPMVTTAAGAPAGPSLLASASEFLQGNWTAGFSSINLEYYISTPPGLGCPASTATIPPPWVGTSISLGSPLGATAGTSNKLVTGLRPTTDYCFRYVGTSVAGINYYGNMLPFTTL